MCKHIHLIHWHTARASGVDQLLSLLTSYFVRSSHRKTRNLFFDFSRPAVCVVYFPYALASTLSFPLALWDRNPPPFLLPFAFIFSLYFPLRFIYNFPPPSNFYFFISLVIFLHLLFLCLSTITSLIFFFNLPPPYSCHGAISGMFFYLDCSVYCLLQVIMQPVNFTDDSDTVL